ncbi:MAG: putative aminoacrylate hydrolase RutD [bacterium]|nr:putative aminoacrylate hydrolase RutD [bacterium]
MFQISRPDGATLIWDQLGSGRLLLCLPGLGAGRESFAQVAQQCQAQRLVVMPDNRGIGASTSPDATFDWETLAADAWAIVEAVAPGAESVDLVGMSFGGIVAQVMAQQHPARIGQLFLVGTSRRQTPYGRRMHQLMQTLIRTVPPEQFGDVMTTFAFPAPFLDAHPGLRSLRQSGITQPLDSSGRPAPGGDGYEGRYRAAFVRMALLAGQHPAALEAPCPIAASQVVAICGAADAMVSPLGQQSVTSLSADPIIVPDGGHLLPELPMLIAGRLSVPSPAA